MPPSRVYPTSECQESIAAGEFCSAQTFNTACVEQGYLNFSCPAGNLDGNQRAFPVNDSGTLCRVCGLSPWLNDTNSLEGFVSLQVSFGPNVFAGQINETGITGYSVYIVDQCDEKVGGAVVNVPVHLPPDPFALPGEPGYSAVPLDCCDAVAYSASFSAVLPEGGFGLRLMVVPVTASGSLNVGLYTEEIVDWFPGASNRGSAGSHRRHGEGAGHVLILLLLRLLL